MRKLKEAVMKSKILEYVSIGEEVELKLWMRNWKDGNPHQKIRSSTRTNNYQRGDLFRTDENKGKNNSPVMGWFHAPRTA